jgi:DNA mismatch endonuclease (patch repair protein)
LLLRRALWAAGVRYRTYVSGLPGSPDLVFKKVRLVVFCDGDFWHGRDWPALRAKLLRRHNADYWVAKIRRNRERDREQADRLTQDGWPVLRFWSSDILADPAAAAARIKDVITSRSAAVQPTGTASEGIDQPRRPSRGRHSGGQDGRAPAPLDP